MHQKLSECDTAVSNKYSYEGHSQFQWIYCLVCMKSFSDAGSTKKDPNRLRRPINAFLIWFHSHYKVGTCARSYGHVRSPTIRHAGPYTYGPASQICMVLEGKGADLRDEGENTAPPPPPPPPRQEITDGKSGLSFGEKMRLGAEIWAAKSIEEKDVRAPASPGPFFPAPFFSARACGGIATATDDRGPSAGAAGQRARICARASAAAASSTTAPPPVSPGRRLESIIRPSRIPPPLFPPPHFIPCRPP